MPERTRTFVGDHPVGAPQFHGRENRHKAGVFARDKIVQDADARTAAHGLCLSEGGRDFEACRPVLAEFGPVVQLRRVEEILNVTDKIVRA